MFLGRSDDPDDKDVDQDQLWQRLVDAQQKKFLMCAMCHNRQMKKEDFHRYGLLNIHAYSLQDLQEINQDKRKDRFIKLRNPWGANQRELDTTNLTSASSSFSPVAINSSDQLPEEFRGEKSAGVFWMKFESFVQYFESVDICKIRPDWYELRDNGDFTPQAGMIDAFQLILTETTQLDLTLYRKIKENLRSQRSELTLSIALVNLETQSNGHHRIYSIPILSERGQQKFICAGGSLPAGRYHLLPFLFNPMKKSVDSTEFNLGEFDES